MENKPTNTKIIALGGWGEVGKNMYCIMHGNDIVVIDCGVIFPEADLLGIDYVIPDFTFLQENQNKIKALIITHGHEDHIGAIPFFVQSVKCPAIYAPKQAKELISLKLEDRNIRYDNLYTYDDTTKLKFGKIEVAFIRTTHSIPDSHSIVITTPDGTIVTTGDYKFDFTPIGPMADIHKMARFGENGVDVLMADSTNALNPGMSASESTVDNALSDIFDEYQNNRIIIATFASNIYRLKHIVETCEKHGRKICVFGRSMENNIKISIEGGYIESHGTLVTFEEAQNLKPSEYALLVTGSQGEPLAALSRIAKGNHKQVKLRPDDVVIFSSSAIPGNALSIGRTINQLYLQGVKVLTTGAMSNLHTSGHANEEEQKLMIRLINPKYVVPEHGEYRMLKKNCDIAIDCGIPEENTFILKNGDVLTLKDHVLTSEGETVPADDIYIDGSRIGEIGSAVIRERKLMANDGILVVIANVLLETRELMIKPTVTTRGFVMVNDNEELISEIEDIANTIMVNKLKTNANIAEMKQQLIADLSMEINNLTGRHPLVVPIINMIKK